MTVNLSDLASLIASLPKATPLPITPAFITEAAFSVGDDAFPAVVTAGYLNREAGTFEINFEALGYTGPAQISLVIDQEDIRAVREMLGVGKAFPLADYEQDDFSETLRALQLITAQAELVDELKVDDYPYAWKGIALECIGIAQSTLKNIADSEADNGTPSDS